MQCRGTLFKTKWIKTSDWEYILLVRTLDSLSALLFDYLTFLYVSLGLACRGVWIHLLHADSSSATTAI